MSVIAIAKGVRMSPRKVGVVAALVRGRTVEDALVILEHTHAALHCRSLRPFRRPRQRGSQPRLQASQPSYEEISVSHGTRPSATARPHMAARCRFNVRTSHISVVVNGEQRPVKKPARRRRAKIWVRK